MDAVDGSTDGSMAVEGAATRHIMIGIVRDALGALFTIALLRLARARIRGGGSALEGLFFIGLGLARRGDVFGSRLFRGLDDRLTEWIIIHRGARRDRPLRRTGGFEFRIEIILCARDGARDEKSREGEDEELIPKHPHRAWLLGYGEGEG